MTKSEQLPFDLGARAAHEREDFWVSESNRVAVGWIDKWPDWPAPALVLYGPPASGKTHLGNVWKKMSGAVEMKSAEQMEDWRSGAVSLFIDDALRFIGDKKKEEYLFHLYNFAKNEGAFMLLTADKPVAEWPFVLPDLKSRLMAAPAAALGSPDDTLMAVVLTKLFSDRQIFVPQDVVQFILPRVGRSFQALRDLVDRVDRKALAEKRPVTIPLVRDLL